MEIRRERKMDNLMTFSFGGGRQSMAALVLASRGVPELIGRTFLFSNVGEDSEKPQTLEYVETIARPFAIKNGIELHELRRVGRRGKRKGEVITIYEQLIGDNRTVDIPVRMSNGAPGNRNCTKTFKIDVIAEWTRRHGATKDNPATVGIGFTWDEIHRIGRADRIKHQVSDYPLIDLRMTTADCVTVIEKAGLPLPPKSACWFCPFQSNSDWLRLRENDPELFDRAVDLENIINAKRAKIGKDMVFLHSSATPLDQAVGKQYELFSDDDSCQSGYCFF